MRRPFRITPAAEQRIMEDMNEQLAPGWCLRIRSYLLPVHLGQEFSLEEAEEPEGIDVVLTLPDGRRVIIDPESAVMMRGWVLDLCPGTYGELGLDFLRE